MQASVSAAVLPTPLGFTTVRGLGLQEAHHLAGETWNTSFAVMSTCSRHGIRRRCLQMLPVQENAPKTCIQIKTIFKNAPDVVHPMPLRA